MSFGNKLTSLTSSLTSLHWPAKTQSPAKGGSPAQSEPKPRTSGGMLSGLNPFRHIGSGKAHRAPQASKPIQNSEAEHRAEMVSDAIKWIHTQAAPEAKSSSHPEEDDFALPPEMLALEEQLRERAKTGPRFPLTGEPSQFKRASRPPSLATIPEEPALEAEHMAAAMPKLARQNGNRWSRGDAKVGVPKFSREEAMAQGKTVPSRPAPPPPRVQSGTPRFGRQGAVAHADPAPMPPGSGR